jgi:glucose/arabinose dehydrogenase
MLRISTILTACVFVVLLAVTATLLQAAPPTMHFPAGVDPSSLRITTFAEGLNFPTGMIELSDGSLLVGTTNTPAAGGTFYNSTNTGSLLRLVDANNDGVADGPGANLAPVGLQGSITSVKQAGDLLFVNHVSNAGHRITVLREGATPSSPFSSVGVINLTYSAPGSLHKTYALETRETPGQPGNYDLFFNIGSELNAANTSSPISLSGLVIASGLLPESIYKMTVTDNGVSPSFSAPTQIASGLRNAAGLDIHPVTGDLWLQDNGIDGDTGDSFGNIAFSADELNVIPAGQIGGAVNDFGFGSNYVRYSDGATIGTSSHVAAFLPMLGVGQSEGANEIAIAPAAFPTGLDNGVFVGFHGQFNSGGANNDENSLLYYDFSTNVYTHIVRAGELNVGHLDGLLSTLNSVFISDLAKTGALFGVPFGPGTGAIYQLAVVPEPSTIGLAVSAGLAFAVLRRRITATAIF